MAVNLLVVGNHGNGKSSTGNTILGGKVFKPSSSSQSSIENIMKANLKIDGKIITVVEGPFINDTAPDDPDDINLAINCSKKAIEHCPDGFDAVIITLKYGVRFTKQEKDAIALIIAMFGDNVITDHGICVFTHGDIFARNIEEDGVSFESWCMKQTGDIENLFKLCNNRYVLFNNRDNGAIQSQRNALLSCVDMLLGKRYTSIDYEQAERNRKGLLVISKRSRLEKETREVLDEISTTLEQINICGNPDYSRNKIIALKKKLDEHKGYIVNEADGTQFLNNIFDNIKVTEMSLETKLRLADLAQQTLLREQLERPLRGDESTHILLGSDREQRDSSCWQIFVVYVRWLLGYRN